MHRLKDILEKKEDEQIIDITKTKVKKERSIYFNVFEYFLVVAMIGTTFYFISWVWTATLGSVIICMQIVKIVDWLTEKKKNQCYSCERSLLGEENE